MEICSSKVLNILFVFGEAGSVGLHISAAENFGAAVCACRSIESVRYKDTAVNRDDVYLVQTPQCFKYEIIKKAYETPYKDSFTDDASVVEAMGEKIHIVEGSRRNIKMTTLLDFKIAEILINEGEY